MRFPMSIDSVARARHFVRSALKEFPGATVDTAELLTSELATNAVLHGRTAFEVSVRVAAGRLHIAVTDGSGGAPVPLSPLGSDCHGRGLLILDELSERWGTTADPPGKMVWFDLVAGARSGGPAPGGP